MLNELGARLLRLGWALLLSVAAVASLALFILTVVSLVLVVVWIGIPLAVAGVLLNRQLARLHRVFARQILGQPVPSPYPGGGWRMSLSHPVLMVRDPSSWRDLIWLMANSTAGLALALVAVFESLFGLFLWWLPRSVALQLDARMAQALLASTEQVGLAERVRALTESRAETVDTQAAELRRIERDLHDGAQARMVAVGMSLGLAEEFVGRDPEYARRLLAEARANNSAALVELRDLVRGIHPPVLADRGLLGAVQALVLATPLPVTVSADDTGRLPAAVESAAYFAIAEALTNVIRHSGAGQAQIEVRRQADHLLLMVSDDGVGGADPSRGSGLRGIERRLSAFDGTVSARSPIGGPTVIRMELPCG